MTSSFPITIIMPVRNRESLVTRALNSIAAQTFRPLRLVLVDNGSKDSTLSVLEEWKNKHQTQDFLIEVRQEHEPGAACARNKGLEGCDSEWVMHFDSDDAMLPHHVERAWKCAQSDPKAWIVGWGVLHHNLEGITSIKPFYSSHALYYGIMEGGMATQRYMVRTELLKKVGGWRDDVMVWNDIELGARLLSALPADAKIIKAKGDPTVMYYSTAQSITGIKYSDKSQEREHAIDCIEMSLPEKHKAIADLKRAILAACYYQEGEFQKSSELYSKVKCTGFKKILCLLAYKYTSAGKPGAAKLLRPFF